MHDDMNTLTINDLPIAGGNTRVTISSQDAWQIWWEWFEKNVAEGRPFSPLKEFAVWMVDGQRFKPSGWFLEF